MMKITMINSADPGCQEVEDLGLRYAGTATTTVSGRFEQQGCGQILF